MLVEKTEKVELVNLNPNFYYTLGIWNPTIWNPETFKDKISNGLVYKASGFSFSCNYVPNHSKTGPLKIRTFLFGFKMVLDKMAAIYLHFKGLAFETSGPIWRLDHLQTNYFLTILILDLSGFQIPAVIWLQNNVRG